MNIVQIGEPIRVLAAFSGGTVEPLQFHWARRAHEIDAVNGRWIDRSGGQLRLHFSVQVGPETYYIHFSTHDVQWWLDQVAAE
jgi:hypothetical protein